MRIGIIAPFFRPKLCALDQNNAFIISQLLAIRKDLTLKNVVFYNISFITRAGTG